jgi:arabinan endo-1,5-alpha-L-arabinosidase
MFHGGGRMVIAAGDRATGAGHFGSTVIDEGVEVMSFHWEADFDMGGRSVLAVRPLLWKNGWPYAGERFRGGTYAVLSERRGYSLEMAVDFVRMQQERQRWGDRNQMQQPPKPIANQKLEDVISTWPDANTPVAVRCSDYMFRPHQLWTFTPVEEAGGYLSAPYFKITIAGTDRALTATADKELATVAYTGAKEQLWRVEQLTDGTYRIMPYAIPGQPGKNQKYCLYSAGDSTPTLAEYDFKSDNSKWNLKKD